MKAKLVMVVMILVLAVAQGEAWAQSTPQLINYQGRLTNATGQPLNGVTVDLTFTFYPSEMSGTPLLTVAQPGVVVTQGIYHVLLGSGGILPGLETTLAAVFQNHSEVWMGVQVGADSEMTPRARLASSPYALKADAAATGANALAVDLNYLRNLDLDGDGHFKPISANLPNDDCNDGDPDIYPGKLETCGDGIDSNCRNGECYLAGAYDTPDNAIDVYVSGNYAYLADDASGLLIFNVIDPAAPTLAGTYDTPGTAQEVFVSGNYAYVADGISGLQIINVSNPTAPTLTGTFNMTGSTFGVYVSGIYAYLAESSFGLRIVNVSNPASPTLTGTYTTPGYAYKVYVSGNYAYVADGNSGLAIINVSNPAEPTLTGSSDADRISDVVVSGNYAYAADWSELKIFNVSNPAAPTLAGTSGYIGYPGSVYVRGNYAWVAANSPGLKILNVSNPAAPILIGTYPTPVAAFGVYVSGDYVYVAAYTSGLQILFALTPP